MGDDVRIRVTWPWLLGTVLAGFASKRLVTSLTGVAWLGYVALLISMTIVLLVFAWTRSEHR